MADAKILDKLQKLHQLMSSPNEHEAQLAAQRAAELMAKHQIEMAEVQAHAAGRGVAAPEIVSARVDGVDESEAPRVENWHKTLLAALGEAFGAKVWMQGAGKRRKFYAVGTADSVSAIRYMYSMLERTVNRLSRAAGRAIGEDSNAWRRSYAVGMSIRIGERLSAGRRAGMQGASTTALAVIDKTKEAIDAKLKEAAPKLREARAGKRKRGDATSYGYRDGERVDIGSADASRLGEGQKKLA